MGPVERGGVAVGVSSGNEKEGEGGGTLRYADEHGKPGADLTEIKVSRRRRKSCKWK